MIVIPQTLEHISPSDAVRIDNLPDFYLNLSKIAAGDTPLYVICRNDLIALFAINEIPVDVVTKDGMGNEAILNITQNEQFIKRVSSDEVFRVTDNTAVAESADLP